MPKPAKPAKTTTTPQPASHWWAYPAALLLALYGAFQVYAPATNGPFVFDDNYLPFMVPNYSPLFSAWVNFNRPILMFSYWLNFRSSGLETLPYHAFNVVFHAVNALLIYAAVRKLLRYVESSETMCTWLARFAAALFLLHPALTESVAYVASRSETLSLMFVLGAFVVFLYRKHAEITWKAAAAVLLLAGCAVATKEHTAVFPALLLLTDYFWNPGFTYKGIAGNWRLYMPLMAAAMVGVSFVQRVLSIASTAGFGMKDLTWYEYFFTQCRAIWLYLRLYCWPAGLNADYDFHISRSLADSGAWLGLLALVLVTGAALYYHRRFPLAAFGWFTFLILIAPTSSFVPIKDPVAERRLYLPFIGLLLITVDLLRRIRVERKTLIAGCCVALCGCAVGTYQRSAIWGDPVALWQDTVAKSPNKVRAHFQLGFQYYTDGKCDLAVGHYAAVAKIAPPTFDLLVDWALALDCLKQTDAALEKLKQASGLENSAYLHATFGKVYAGGGRYEEALKSLDEAQRLDGNYAMTYAYRGSIHLERNEVAAAIQNYRRALELDPNNSVANQGLRVAQERQRRPQR